MGKSGEQKHGGTYSAYANTTAATAAYAYNNTATIAVNFRYSIWIYLPSGIVFNGTQSLRLMMVLLLIL